MCVKLFLPKSGNCCHFWAVSGPGQNPEPCWPDSFGKMGDFINFEAAQVDFADDAVMEVEKCESAQTKWYEFIDDETQIDDNIEDY